MAVVQRLGVSETDLTAVKRAQLSGHADVRGAILRLVLQMTVLISVLILAVLLVQVVSGGWEILTTRFGDFLTGKVTSRPTTAGIGQALKGSFWVGAAVVLFAFPVGIGTGIYLEEYEKHGRLGRFIDLNIRNLAGVPSVVFGILGFAVFTKTLSGITGGATPLSGGLTVAIVVLPIIIITTAEAIRAVPNPIREAGYAVGATRWEVVRHFILPYSAPGIITGTILGLARALGEAAPLLLVGAITSPGRNPAWFDVSQVRESFTAMPVLINDWAADKASFRPNTAAAITVMLVVVLAANSAAIVLRNRFEKRRSA